MQLVTGGAGFIGSSLVEALLARGERVRVLDNFSTGKREHLRGFLDEVEVVDGDLRDERAVSRATDGIEIVYHQAALPSVPRSIADPRSTYDVNVIGTLNLLIAARDAGCRRVVFASSSSVYGDTPILLKVETITAQPLSPYASSKFAGEQLCGVFTRVYGLETVALRYFNVFGPRQDPSSQYAAVIPRFLRALQHARPPTIYGDGEQSRDFTYIDNVVSANLKAATTAGVSGEVFNIATGSGVTINRMLARLAELTGVDVRPQHEPPRPGDVRHSLADISAARAALGYEVLVPFDDGLKRTVEAAAWSQSARPSAG